MRVLALTKYDMLAASTRQRFRLYEPALAAAGITVHYAPLLDDRHVAGLVEGRRGSPVRILAAYARRLATLMRAGQYDGLWVYLELFPYLPGLFERLARLTGLPLILDYDDAIFHQYDSSRSVAVRRLLGRKLVPLMEAADACCCGNAYLLDYASRHCRRTMLLPTVVDTESYRPATPSGGPVTIGWIGSPSTWPNVRPLLPVLKELVSERGLRFRVIGAGRQAEQDRFDGMDLVAWDEASEVDQVQQMDIGIMPLDDRPFQRGKCGYKLIQYMACGLPVVASPVGVNAQIVREGDNGYLASTPDEWREALERLLDDADLRHSMGQRGREIAVAEYSLASQAPRLVALMQDVLKGRTSRSTTT